MCYMNFDKYKMKPYFEKAYQLKTRASKCDGPLVNAGDIILCNKNIITACRSDRAGCSGEVKISRAVELTYNINIITVVSHISNSFNTRGRIPHPYRPNSGLPFVGSF